MRIAPRVLAIAACAALASACASLPQLPELAPAAETSPSPRERVRVAVELLDAGEERAARAELRAALDEQPGNATARRLLDQIDRDPHDLLGREARPYTVRQGETMSQLSERFLGDALLFYALSRYNRLEAPSQLRAGQQLMIPQRATASIALRATLPPPPAPAAAAPADPVRAQQVRLQALQRLNTGQVDSAVALLRQAQALDADNAAIQRDLDRATRMQASLAAAPASN